MTKELGRRDSARNTLRGAPDQAEQFAERWRWRRTYLQGSRRAFLRWGRGGTLGFRCASAGRRR
jgi:hypothetical protein